MAGGQKILLYIHGLTGGGAERVWALLASGFAARGFDVVLATDFAATENVSYLHPSVRQIVLRGNHLTSTLRLWRLLRREQPDVIVSALSASNLKMVIAATLAGQLKRAIISYHGYTDTEPQPLSRIGYFLTPILSRLAAATICVSDGLRDYVVSRWHAPADRTVRIYNPVVTDGTPVASQEELEARPPVILASGRFIHYKNFPALVRAFAQVQPTTAQLHILGEGPERGNIEAEIRRSGLEDRVTLLGYRPHPWPHYEQARCFVLPSTKEPFGLVLVEALAHGLPAVATACHGPCEILTDGIGQIVELGDEVALAQAMTRALAAPGDPRPRQAHARRFSLDAGLDAYEALFDSLDSSATVRHANPAVTITSG